MVPITNWGRLGNQMFQFAYIFAQMKKGYVPDIYVQYPQYFHEYEKEIQEMFGQGVLKTPMDSVAVHVRRTDYLTNPLFADLTATDYYERAMALFPGERFIVCSDDIAWCKKKWPGNPQVRFSELKTDLDDMNLMASCKHNIIANSSFSWWSAYLNPYEGKRVVYPKLWHTDGVVRVGFPKEWMGL